MPPQNPAAAFLFAMKKRTRKKGRVARIALTTVLALFLGGCIALLLVFGIGFLTLDREEDMAIMESMRASRSTMLYYSKGHTHPLTSETYQPQEMDVVYGDENMIWVDSEDIPNALKEAFISIEDRRFYTHDGVDWKRTLYATLNYVFRFRDAFGGSTITQQLVKNVHGDKEVTPMRKVKEIIRATRVEKRYTKDEILTYYLNIVPMGHSCVGVRSAARYYFGKEPMELSLTECAALAAITNAPSRYEPVGHLKENTIRRNLILTAMWEEGYLDREALDVAKERETVLQLDDSIFTASRLHNWYTETVLADVANDLAQKLDISLSAARTMVYRGGLTIYTMMDRQVQETLETYFSRTSSFITSAGTLQGAMVVMEPHSGDILGIVGGTGEKTGNLLLNRAKALYPPGSSLKPLALYAPAIDSGLIHWGTAFVDAPKEYDGHLWPHNSPNLFAGQITTHEALARSKNTVAVDLYERLGKEQILATLRDKLGFSSLVESGSPNDLSAAPLALGQLTKGVSPLEMCSAFCTFSNGGIWYRPRSYLRVLDSKGRVLLDNSVDSRRVWSEQGAYIMAEMLREVVSYGTARSITLDELVDTGGKTGTSGGDKDKWFVGFTPEYTAAVHLGFDNGTAIPAGCRQHLNTFDDVMWGIYNYQTEDGLEQHFRRPSGIYEVSYCMDSGGIPTELCQHDPRGSRVGKGYFMRRAMPASPCKTHIIAYYDLVTEKSYIGETPSPFVYPFICLDLREREVPEGVSLLDTPYTFTALEAHFGTENKEEEDSPDSP